MIDWGFVMGAFIPCECPISTPIQPPPIPPSRAVQKMKKKGPLSPLTVSPDLIAAAAQNRHYSTVWRTSLGIGALFPLLLLAMRLRLKEPDEYAKESMRRRTPYKLVLRFYWWRLFCVSLIWFLYDVSGPRLSFLSFSPRLSPRLQPSPFLSFSSRDSFPPPTLSLPIPHTLKPPLQFSAYAFGIYSSSILSAIAGKDAPLTTVFGWNTVINIFYLPGTMFGALVSDWAGPKHTLVGGVVAQAVVGYVMAGVYGHISRHVAAFAVVYGLFLTLGELGPGNNIGLLAAKTCATGVRGRYYGIAAAVGKVGAFVGTWVFPYIQAAGGRDTVQSAQYPFWVAASLSLLSAAVAFFFIPDIGQDTITLEDARFRRYLESQGWDTNMLGLAKDPSNAASYAEEEQAPVKPDAP